MSLSISGFLRAVVFFLVAVSSARADGDEGRQVPGTDACTCSPPDFTFTLNFGGTCDTSDVVPSDGIERVRCIVSDEVFQPVDDEVPTVIDQIDILEFGLNLTLLSETAYLGPYNDGDMFDFTSIIGTPQYDGENVPQIFQISLTGRNAENNIVRNSLGVVYTNECGFEPIFNEGDMFGWLLFTELLDPLEEFCEAQPTAAPVAGPPTSAPEPDEECSCSPRSFTFRFDFEGECPGNIEADDAIERVGCVIDNDFGDQLMDNTPTMVTRIQIEEQTAGGGIMKLDIANQVFVNGDTFTYESASEDGFLIPVSLQLVLEGENEIGATVFNVNLFEYTNECGIEVEFDDDAAVGWLIIEEYEPSRLDMCVAPTPAPVDPTQAPVDPTSAPVDPTPAPVNPTSAPVDPTGAPTPRPTTAPPTNAVVQPSQMVMTPMPVDPTQAPVNPTPSPVDPTAAPVDPTAAPVDPTPAPVDPTPAPVDPTRAPTPRPTPNPTRAPTPNPTRRPTMAVAQPSQMVMTPMPNSPPVPTEAPPTGAAAQPTQMTMPPAPDNSMSFDVVNRMLELLHKQEVAEELLRAETRESEKSNNNDSLSPQNQNIRRRLG